MKRTVTKSEFTTAFHDMGRGGQFSHKGLCELYDFLVEMEDNIGEELELDVIALCYDFTESDIYTIASDYGIDLSDCEDEEDVFQSVLDELNNSTMVVYADEDSGMILYANY